MDGVINIYKPIGVTSFDVVREVKKAINISKVGHTGTLDPMACGVLPVCIGKGTKLIDYIMSGVKTYNAELTLGVITDTYDREGAILSEQPFETDEKKIAEVIKSFIGNIKQVPPMYSALKHNGKKLYEYARQGIEIEREARDVTIYDIIIHDIVPPVVNFTVVCSKGTYIRSLCYDIGEKLNCGAMMSALERSGSGVFTKETAVHLEDITKSVVEQNLISIDNALSNYEVIHVNEKFEKLLRNGVRVSDRTLLDTIKTNDIVRVYSENNILIGIGALNNNVFQLKNLFV